MVLVRLGVTEQDECVTGEIPIHEPLVALDSLRDAALKIADRLSQILKGHTVASRRRDQFAGHRGDLAAFGFTRVARDKVAREFDPRRRCCDDTVCAGRQAQAGQV